MEFLVQISVNLLILSEDMAQQPGITHTALDIGPILIEAKAYLHDYARVRRVSGA